MADPEEMEEIPMSAVKEFLLTFMPEKCYDQFFLHFNFAHVPCLRIVLSKCMGLWIMVGSVFALLPQIWKVLRAGSADGLSLTSTILSLYSASGYVAYCISQGFPIGAWGESLFILTQVILLNFLILHYSGQTVRALLFLMLYCAVMYVLTSALVPQKAIAVVQDSGVLAIIASRLIQAGSNYLSKHTGQLSTASVILVFIGALAHIFVSLQETGQSLSSLTQVLACLCSGVLVFQMFHYGKAPLPAKEKSE
ncbi:mannose-P-dolichol utilization defect 1 protein-like [Engraulis encrasicolus]|uniref:mannose-P-dolichol utilization defect 1 protein-like n=1 Tax=Engraulis encrasicolus TaxID=184585 RepID=UPI002FD5F191